MRLNEAADRAPRTARRVSGIGRDCIRRQNYYNVPAAIEQRPEIRVPFAARTGRGDALFHAWLVAVRKRNQVAVGLCAEVMNVLRTDEAVSQ